ncbi:MAG: hypothetical protein RML12_10340 [Xanthomonadales bacterium]|nr:hypothetical protein [Xanthomonadales bacterium]
MSRFRSVFALSVALVLVACGRDQSPEQPAAATASSPVESVRVLHEALRRNDLRGMLEAMLPPAEVAEMRERWERKRGELLQVSEEGRAQFAATMGMLTQPGAADAIMATLEPQLAELDQQMAQMPMAIMMGSGFIIASLEQAENLSAEQKQQARQAVEALAQWAMKTPFNDRARIRKAVEALVAAAGQLGLARLEDLERLSFDELLVKGGIVLAGLRNALAAFDFPLDQALDSFKVELVSEQGDEATVRSSYSLFGVPFTTEVALVRRDGRWYGRELLAQLAQAKEQARQAAEPQSAE